jgi:hypothetical protein
MHASTGQQHAAHNARRDQEFLNLSGNSTVRVSFFCELLYEFLFCLLFVRWDLQH